MTDIEQLMARYPQFEYQFKHSMPDGLKGLTINDKIIISADLSDCEKLQWLYEEIGHALTSAGDITDYHAGSNCQQEKRARKWGMEHHIPYKEIMKYKKDSYETDYDIANDLGVQIDYLHTVGFMYGLKYKSVD
ncbi:hypothetical protein IWT25_02530 [Secundilactobacillus pentosiphilus]|uniref:IrrE N-terminal-like domain-containing protein n=1 Tax=Secundilactobacillus pentosiphilus TaxID=1714682 RepID=A0A1Z5J026_9LACO|nr:ImmA/IrrE family metallo-endopeptidase [Secundilactobacillus pentosiphilus]GAX07182.1 hypothetical protein IWT25_02530 [Secundilactobacillus pentosiphilus]